MKAYRSVPGRRRILEVCQVGNSSCDLLPGADTFLITGEGKSADLLDGGDGDEGAGRCSRDRHGGRDGDDGDRSGGVLRVDSGNKKRREGACESG